MSTLSKSSVATLERKLAKIEQQLRELDADLFEEMQFIRRLIDQKRSGSTNEFSDVKTPRAAIERVLTDAGRWMTKGEIVQRLTEGGFITTEAERWNINTLLNYHTKPGKTYLRHGDGEGWDMLVGKKDWALPK